MTRSNFCRADCQQASGRNSKCKSFGSKSGFCHRIASLIIIDRHSLFVLLIQNFVIVHPPPSRSRRFSTTIQATTRLSDDKDKIVTVDKQVTTEIGQAQSKVKDLLTC